MEINKDVLQFLLKSMIDAERQTGDKKRYVVNAVINKYGGTIPVIAEELIETIICLSKNKELLKLVKKLKNKCNCGCR